MSRLVSFGLLALVLGSVSSMGYAQCGGPGYYHRGGFRQQRYYQSQPRSYYHSSSGCCNGGGYYQGGGATYATPPGFGAPGQTYQPQPYYQPQYSPPQGSGMRLFQGSGSR